EEGLPKCDVGLASGVEELAAALDQIPDRTDLIAVGVAAGAAGADEVAEVGGVKIKQGINPRPSSAEVRLNILERVELRGSGLGVVLGEGESWVASHVSVPSVGPRGYPST